MGHTRVGTLPASRKWNELRELLAQGASADAVGAKAIRNVGRLFGDADQDTYGELAQEPIVGQAIWALMTLPALAREGNDYAAALAKAGLHLPPDAFDSTIAFAESVARACEERVGAGESTVFGVVALSALRSTLLDRLASSAGALFESSSEEIKRTWAEHGTPARFSDLAQAFLSRLLERTVQYYVSREVPQQLGRERRFGDLDAVDAFNRDLSVWCDERAKIAQKFAAGWLSKERYERGRPTIDAAGRFVAYALAKVGSEVRVQTE